jgi:hypothetical protein
MLFAGGRTLYAARLLDESALGYNQGFCADAGFHLSAAHSNFKHYGY